MFEKQLWQFRDNYGDGETVSSSTSPQAAPNFAQPNLILISLLFCSKLKKKKNKKKTQQIITWLKNKLIIWIPRYSTESPRAFWAFGHCDFYVTFLFISLFL